MQNFQKLIKLPQLFLFLLGNAFVAYSYQGFVSANDFLSGGIYGVSGIVTYFFSFLPFSLVVLLFNIPCMIWAWRELDKRFVILTTIALLLQVVFLQLFEGVVIYNNDLLLAAIFAGVFVGAGDALVLRSGSGSSGVHLIAMVLRQKFGISVSTVTTSINTVIILLSTGIFGIEKGLYTLILIFASGQVVHAILDGLSSKRTAFIITAKGDEVGAVLIQGLNRGVTKLPAEGLYTHTPVSLLMCVTNMLEVGRLKMLVQSVDPQAFITFYETTDFRGHFLKHNIFVDKDEDEETAAMSPPPKRPTRPRPRVTEQAEVRETPETREPREFSEVRKLSKVQELLEMRNLPDLPEEQEMPEERELAEVREFGEVSELPEEPSAEPVPQKNTAPPAPENSVPFSSTSGFRLTIQPEQEPEPTPPPVSEPEPVRSYETANDNAVTRLRDLPSSREASRRQNSVITGDVPRPERRSFVPPAPPSPLGGSHSRNRARDFWGDSSDDNK